MSQEDKIFPNLAGEFTVASELKRRCVLASVTYGASKSADIFAMNRDMTRIIRIEVKATDKGKWPIGEHYKRYAQYLERMEEYLIRGVLLWMISVFYLK